MATQLENINTALDALYAALATSAGRPNYTIDGETFDFNGLCDRIDKLEAAKNRLQGSFENASIGET